MPSLPTITSGSALYLYERLDKLAVRSGSVTERDNYLSWRDAFQIGSTNIFAARLDSLQISDHQAQLVSDDSFWEEQEEISHWWQALADCPLSSGNDLDLDQTSPFAPLWWPLIFYARNELLEHSPAAEILLPSAQRDLLEALLKEICDLAAHPTYELFDQYRNSGGSFEQFIAEVRTAKFGPILKSYPALSRCLRQLVLCWIQTNTSFVRRLIADLLKVLELIDSKQASLKVSAAKLGISDRHDGGSQVILVTFEQNRKVLYKPKNLSLSERLNSLNAWLAKEGYDPGWRFPKVHWEEAYGWEEFVDRLPCRNRKEVQQYYRGAGGLVCLAYLLNAHDLLFENLVASGLNPVPIDTETFFHPQPRSAEPPSETKAPETYASEKRPSVIETGLLPFWQLSSSHPVADFSGLGGVFATAGSTKTTQWQDANTDFMKPVEQRAPGREARNGVYWEDRLQDVRQYRDELISGLTELYKFILDRRESFLKFIETFRGASTRLILRPTQLYALLEKNSLSAKNLRSGMRRSLVFEQLYRAPLRQGYLSPEVRSLIDFEVASLLGLDVPRFYLQVDSTNLRLAAGLCLTGFLQRPPLESVIQRIKAMSLSDLDFQAEVIGQSLRRFPRQIPSPLTHQTFEDFALEFVREISERAIQGPSNYLWPLPAHFATQVSVPQRIGLYLGDLGILIFLAAAEQTLQRSVLPPHFAARFAQILNNIQFEDSFPLGICHGLGSLIYGCTLLGKIRSQTSWIDLALRLAQNATTDRIAMQAEPDMTSGVAGFLLAATRLHEITADPTTTGPASLAFAALQKSFDCERGWRRPAGGYFTGFAHGLAGIAFACLAYAREFNSDQALALAQKALDIDRKYFDDTKMSWPIGLEGGTASVTNWCNGSAGILLARCAAWQLTGEPRIKTEITAVLQSLRALNGFDHWCCGNFGIAEVFDFLAEKMNLETARLQADQLIQGSLDRAGKSAFFRFYPSLGNNFCFEPSLFRGISGIGYSLLRRTQPAALPNILAFEV